MDANEVFNLPPGDVKTEANFVVWLHRTVLIVEPIQPSQSLLPGMVSSPKPFEHPFRTHLFSGPRLRNLRLQTESGGSSTMSQPRIFVCDDHAHITRAVSLWLRKVGFLVETFDDGQETWDALQTEKPSLLISDCQMPNMHGLELCRKIRSDFRFEDLPIILLTAKGYELDEQMLQRELQISAVVTKPFNPIELILMVQRFIGSTEESAT
jgi:two-component system alkaline phosphatase synthesis response regulator PhoP